MRQLALSLASPAPAIVLRINRNAWCSLNQGGRDDLSQPRGDARVTWTEQGEALVARVPGPVAATLRGMCEALGVELSEVA
jgi:hypothetical protein